MGYTDVLLLRYLPSGQLDTGFGTGGKVVYDTEYAYGSSGAIQADGKIVVGGCIANDVGTPDFDLLLLRYNSDGTLDPSFGQNGVVRYDGGTFDERISIAAQADGKILVAYGHLLLRYNINGTQDASFGTGGAITLDSGYILSIAIQVDGKIVVAGSTGTHLLMLRYDENGALDSGFGTNGVVTYDSGSREGARSVAIQPDGKILVGGVATEGTWPASNSVHPDPEV